VFTGTDRDLLSPFLEESLGTLPVAKDHIEIHTSDRNLFRRCRRKWNWQSMIRENLVPLGTTVAPLWFGSGWHFIMEDYHGYRRYPSVDHAIVAYKEAFKKSELPPEPRELLDLMAGMAHYYTEDWLKYHPEPYQTLVVNGIPQVEVDYDYDLTDELFNYGVFGRSPDMTWLERFLDGRRVIYRMTFDRVVIDEYGFIYILDYKTARQIDTQKLSNDPQVSSYSWGGFQLYDDKFGGVIWQQHFKGVPVEPEWLMSSGRFSMNKNQKTTYPLARRAIKEKYGKIPAMYQDFLQYLAEAQGDAGDAFVRRDILRRNPMSRRTEHQKILDEVLDMLNPNLPLYPNPTRDCTWDCPFKDPCIALDDGSDLEFLLTSSYEHWKGYKQDWKQRILLPDGTPFYQENT
jgi:hypothetical protein